MFLKNRLIFLVLFFSLLSSFDGFISESGVASEVDLSLPPFSFGHSSMVAGLLSEGSWNHSLVNSAEDISLADLGHILFAGQGENRPHRRVTPSAGATYPLDLWIVHNTGVQGLEKGIIAHYLPETHSLRSETLGEEELTNFNSAVVKCWLLITSTYARTGDRYGDRASRYITLEVGHALENIRLEVWARQLGMVTFFQPNLSLGPSKLPNDSQIEVLVGLGFITTSDSSETFLNNHPLNEEPTKPLVSIQSTSLSVEEVIYSRQSVRDYSSREVRSDDLVTLLRLSSGFPSLSNGHERLTISVVTGSRVDGIAEGVYTTNATHPTLNLVQNGSFLNSLQSQSLEQPWVGSSAFSIILTVYGEGKDYQYGLLESGIVSQRLYHACYVLGFGMVVVGAFSDHGVAQLVQETGQVVYVIPVGPLEQPSKSFVDRFFSEWFLLGALFGLGAFTLYFSTALTQNRYTTKKLGIVGTRLHIVVSTVLVGLGTTHVALSHVYPFVTNSLTLQTLIKSLGLVFVPPELVPTNIESSSQWCARLAVWAVVTALITKNPFFDLFKGHRRFQNSVHRFSFSLAFLSSLVHIFGQALLIYPFLPLVMIPSLVFLLVWSISLVPVRKWPRPKGRDNNSKDTI